MKTKRRNVVGKRFVTMVKRFTVEITRPCVRAGYYGGETVLSAGKEPAALSVQHHIAGPFTCRVKAEETMVVAVSRGWSNVTIRTEEQARNP